MNAPWGNRLTLLLLLLSGVILTGIIRQLTTVDPPPPLSTRLSLSLHDAEVTIPVAPEPYNAPSLPLGHYREMSQRPLFTQGRKPPEKRKPFAPKVVLTMPFILEGIIITAQQRAVLVRRKNTRESQLLKRGGEAEGWRLEAVEPLQATFKNGTRREVLLYKPERLDSQLRPLYSVEVKGGVDPPG
jgi:hypothetical protein